jgi:hypothetical protein
MTPFVLLLVTAPLWAVALVVEEGADEKETGRAVPAVSDGPVDPRPFGRGEGLPVLWLPRDEELVFHVRASLAFVELRAGTVTMSTRVEPYRPSILAVEPGTEDPEEDGAEVGVMRVHAEGAYQWYSMDASIESRVLPQDWPHVSYRYTHEGSEQRRREILIGTQKTKGVASYRKDTSDGAPKGTRIWREPKTRRVPEGTLDTLTAVYLARTMLRENQDELTFPLLDKLDLWEMRIRRGETKPIETAAGTFEAVEIVLDPRPWPGESVKEKKRKRFQGLFGLRGSIHMWVDVRTGVPVCIQGDLPIGFLDLGLDVRLESYRGTPDAFRPLPPPEKRKKKRG